MILKEGFQAFNDHQDKLDKIKKQIDKKKKQIERLQKKGTQNSWITAILEPFAKEMMVLLNRTRYEIMGPFGLSSETSIWFYDTDIERKDCKMDSITFRPDLWSREDDEDKNPFGVMVKDYKNPTKSFNDNTIGALNGGNYPSIIPPVDADMNWFLQHVSKAGERD